MYFYFTKCCKYIKVEDISEKLKSLICNLAQIDILLSDFVIQT